MIDQYTTHHGRTDGKEVSLALPIDSRLIDHPHVGLMNQRRRTETIAHRFILQEPPGQPTKVVVHQRKQTIGFPDVSVLASTNEICNRTHGRHHLSVWLGTASAIHLGVEFHQPQGVRPTFLSLKTRERDANTPLVDNYPQRLVLSNRWIHGTAQHTQSPEPDITSITGKRPLAPGDSGIARGVTRALPPVKSVKYQSRRTRSSVHQSAPTS